MVGTRLGSLYMTMSILVYSLANSKWPTGIRAAWGAEEEYRGDFVGAGPWGIGLVKDICILVGSS